MDSKSDGEWVVWNVMCAECAHRITHVFHRDDSDTLECTVCGCKDLLDIPAEWTLKEKKQWQFVNPLAPIIQWFSGILTRWFGRSTSSL